jgi:hypothetical protein
MNDFLECSFFFKDKKRDKFIHNLRHHQLVSGFKIERQMGMYFLYRHPTLRTDVNLSIVKESAADYTEWRIYEIENGVQETLQTIHDGKGRKKKQNYLVQRG